MRKEKVTRRLADKFTISSGQIVDCLPPPIHKPNDWSLENDAGLGLTVAPPLVIWGMEMCLSP